MTTGTTTRTPGTGESWRTHDVGSGVLVLPTKIDLGATSAEDLWTKDTPGDSMSRTATAPSTIAFLTADDGSNRYRVKGNATGGLYIQGPGATDAAVVGNPLYNGGFASDAAPTAVSADGELVPLWLDRRGAQFTKLWQLNPFRVTPVVSTSPAYGTTDCLGPEQLFDAAALYAGGSCLIVGATLTTRNTTLIAVEGYVAQVDPTFTNADNGIFDITDANVEAAKFAGVMNFTQWFSTASNMMSFGSNQGTSLWESPIPVVCQDGTNTDAFWVQLVTRTAVTPGSTSDYVLDLTVAQLV